MTASLRIATFNIHHGARSDNTLDLEGTARVLDSLDADVIALQEVDRHFSARSQFVDQASWLGERLGMHAEFAPNISLPPLTPGLPRREYGLALLTVRPPLGRFHAQLPEPRVIERRGVLSTVVDAGGTCVEVFNVHLTTGPGKFRRAQFRAVRELVDRSPHEVIVTGDLNSPSFHLLDYWTLTRGLKDAWRSRGYVRHRLLRGFTNPVLPLPLRRIDYVLTTAGLTTTSIRRVRTRASDHLPVVADIAVTSPR